MKKILLIIFLLPFLAFSQVAGDYRSAATGSWTSLASWQYYNGSAWVAATTYPGQTTGTGTVTIRDSHVVTLDVNITNSFTSLVIGTGVSGVLFIANNVTVNTTNVKIMSNGIMSFDKNKTITFPPETTFLVSSGGKLYAENSDCSNQTALYIGSTKVSACVGNGGGALSNFDSFSNGGGTGSATSNTPVCAGNQLVLTAIPPTATSGSYTYTYQWSGAGIYNLSFNSSATYTINNVNIYNHGGTYKVEIKRNDGFVSTVSTNVVVNPAIAAPTNTRSDNVNWCTATIRWDGAATNFNLDVATSNTFSAGSILSSYNNLSVGNVRELILSGLSPNTTYYFRIKSAGNCASTSYSPVASFTTMSIAAPVANSGYGSCNDWVAQWNGVYNTSGNQVDGYYLDVAIDNAFTNYVSGYQNLDVGQVIAYNITGLARGGIYYYRVRAKTSCGVSGNSNVITFTERGNGSSNPGTISGGVTSVCVGSSTPAFVNSGSNPSTGTWSIFNQTGSATITQSGVVTGVSVGTVKVVFTTYNGGCGTSTSTDLTITAGGTVGVASSSPLVCVNTAMTSITHTTSGYTGITSNGVSGANGLPNGVSATFASNTITISGTPTVSGTFNYSIPLTGGCSGVNATGTITVNPVPSTPTPGTITQPTCTVVTGSVVLSSLPSSGSWTITATPATSGLTGLTGTGTTTTVAGLSGGTTYTFTVSNGSCNSSASANVVINIPPALVTWNGSNWSSTPTINNRVEFLANYSSGTNSPANVDACSCQVKNNAVVVFNTGHTLKVVNEVQVVAGTLTFEDDASLVQVNDAAVNSGNIIYKRKTTPVNRYDFTYWSSPVTHVEMTLGKLSPKTFYDKYFSYNNAWVLESRTTVMLKGEGYSVRAPQTTAISGSPVVFEGIFEGVPNNGEVKKTLTGSRVYLIGNPYPSAIDADQFLDINSAVLQGTLYFWTHNSPPSDAVAGDKKYNYTTNDYATYNRTGGVGSRVSKADAAATGGDTPNGKIAAAQGFFAPASAAGGELVFNNAMRLSTTGAVLDNAQFFKLSTNSKTAKTTTTANTEKNRIWLNLTNNEGAFKQTLIGYVTGATNDYDGAFDGVTYDGNQYVDFYSINNEVNLSIQGRALPFVKKDSVALGYKSTIKGEFKISIDQVDGSLTTQNIFLEDKDLKTLHDLKKEAYTFTTEKGIFNNRFVLRYVDKNAIDEAVTPEIPGEVSNTTVVVSANKGEIKINAAVKKIEKVVVYNIAGRKLFEKHNVDANILVTPNLVWNHQVLIVDVVLVDGTKYSRKIIN